MFNRPRPKRDPNVSKLEHTLEAELKDLRKVDRAMEAVVEAWEASMPRGLAPHFDGILPGGKLIVRVSSASARFLAARALRDGGERAIVRAGKGKVRRVEVKVGAKA